MKAVQTPLAGQSANPSAKDHLGVLKQVIKEEEAEIEKNKIGEFK